MENCGINGTVNQLGLKEFNNAFSYIMRVGIPLSTYHLCKIRIANIFPSPPADFDLVKGLMIIVIHPNPWHHHSD